MTSDQSERVAVLGAGLMGTSIAMASTRVGCSVTGWDQDPETARRAAQRGAFSPAGSLLECVAGADVVVVATPVASVAQLVVEALSASPRSAVTDAASIKGKVIGDARAMTASGNPSDMARFVPGHPMGGGERSGPDHASASVVDGIIWVLTPVAETDLDHLERVERWIRRIGAVPTRMEAERHDKLVAVVSHLPQVASTALMGLAAVEEADEPEILLLAAGGFRDLTRLAASNPALWSAILLSNGQEVARAIDLFVERLLELKLDVLAGRGESLEAVFALAKEARLRLAAKPTVRAGVAVLQVPIPDRPGSLAQLTAALGAEDVNIEDLQIVHSPEGGRGTVHLTVAASDAQVAAKVLSGRDFDPIRLA
jgi:prephenate dehydrogenase